ncbi:MAG: nucleotidyltransferase family protein [Candidatus Bipolaricaulota bacterium]
METIILAGGYAKRLWPITLERPKPLLPVAGAPILDYIVRQLPEGPPPLLSINRRFSHQFDSWARAQGRPLTLAVEETRSEEEKLGAVGALSRLISEHDLDDDLLVIGGDNLFSFDLQDFLTAFQGRPLIAVYDLGDPEVARHRYGVALVDGRRIVGFQEKPDRPASALAATACYLFPRRVLPLIPVFITETDRGQDAPGYFLEWLRAREPMEAYRFSEGWFDIGGREAYIDANMQFTGGSSWIHPEANVGQAGLHRCVVLGSAEIRNARLTGCVVDEEVELEGVELRNVLVGRGTRIRPG